MAVDPYANIRRLVRLPVQSVQTYSIAAPLSTHWRKVTCEEFGCARHRDGWRSGIDERTELGQRQAFYIRKASGRRFFETKHEAGLTIFDFPAGQTCFEEHQTRLDRQEIYTVRGGDFRGSTGVIRRHTRAADWVDDFANHQDRVARQIEKG